MHYCEAQVSSLDLSYMQNFNRHAFWTTLVASVFMNSTDIVTIDMERYLDSVNALKLPFA